MNVGVIGAGTICQKRHLPTLQDLETVSKIYVADRNSTRSADLASSIGGEAVSRSTLLERVDLVLVATPPWAHTDCIVEALNAETCVLTEKPLAVTPAEVEQIKSVAEESDAWVSVVHNFLYQRSVRSARKQVQTGSIGDLNRVYAIQVSDPAWNIDLHGTEWFERLPGGMFWDESPHMLYLLESFVGELRTPKVSVDDRAVQAQPIREISVKYQNDISAQVKMIFDAPLTEWWLLLIGTDGIVAVDIFRNICLQIDRAAKNDIKGVLWPLFQTGTKLSTGIFRSCLEYIQDQVLGSYGAPRAGFDIQLRKTIEAVQEGKEPPVTLMEGENVYDLMWTIADTGGFAPHDWPKYDPTENDSNTV